MLQIPVISMCTEEWRFNVHDYSIINNIKMKLIEMHVTVSKSYLQMYKSDRKAIGQLMHITTLVEVKMYFFICKRQHIQFPYTAYILLHSHYFVKIYLIEQFIFLYIREAPDGILLR